MKHFTKRSLAVLMALLMVFSLFAGMSFKTDAATVDYQYGSTDSYTNIIKNWGTRGETATFLSPNAEEFYAQTSYEELAALEGSSDITVVNTSALYVALYELMSGAHTTKNSYGESRYLMAYTDCQNNGAKTTTISAFYSGEAVGPDWDSGATWNREHVWPNSKGGTSGVDNDTRNNETDIIMLRPETSSNNSSRGNKAYGVSSGYYFPNLSDTYDVRGDVARTVLYVYVRWGTEESEVLANMWGSDGVMESLDVLLTWMEEDPVDTWEMGRNDSVQSITGTRNVFVDYPELAFELFETEIPEMDTPSGIAGTAGYEITAVSNNEAYGTVSVNGSNVTAYPASGYQVAGWQITSGTAEVTANGNVFTVTASSDCTIMITFAQIPSYTVQIMENGTLASSLSVQSGQSYTFPEYTGTVPAGYTFCGWVGEEILTATSQKPAEIYQPGATLTVGENAVYYSLLWYINSEDQSDPQLNYELVDSTEDLVIGSSYIIAAAEYDYAMGGISSSGNNRTQAGITKDGTALSLDIAGGVSELTLREGLELEVTEPVESSQWVYEKVTEAPEDWTGDYLIVYEDGSVIYDGSLAKLDAASNTQAVTVDGSSITADQQYQFTIAPVSGGYSVQSAGGYYIGQTSDANGLVSSTGTVYVNTISMNDDGTVNIIGSGGAYLRYNSASNQLRFRYYKSSTYTNQKAITLYKRTNASAAAAAEDAAQTSAAATVSTYAFFDADNNGYLYAAASTGNYLKLQETLNENGSFAITVNADGTCTIAAQGSNTNNTIRYNASDGLFSCYGSTGTTKNVALYVGIPGSGTVYFITKADTGCAHANTTTVTVDASCTENGSVTVTCDDCGETVSTAVLPATGHTEVETVIAPTLSAQGYTQISCSVCGADLGQEEYTNALTDVAGWNLTLGSDLSVNFKINVDASIRDTAKIRISVANALAVYEVSALTADADGSYCVSVKVAAAQMTDEIAVQIVNGADQSETKTYSVRSYADTVLAGDYSEATKLLVTQMLHYGAAAQNYFAYHTDNLANAGLEAASQTAPEAASSASYTGTVDGISYSGATLLFREKVAVRFYFTVTGDISTYSFTANGNACTPVKKGDMYYIEIGDINPQDLEQSITAQVNGALTVSYSPMNYMANMYQKGTEKMQALVQALYHYYLAAEAYVG